MIAAVAFVAIVVGGFYGYRQSPQVDASQPAAASSAPPAAAPTATAQPQGPFIAPSETAAANRAPAAVPEPSADPQPEESRRPNAAAGHIARPRPAAAAKAGSQASPRKEVCSDAAAALGLCTMTPEDRKPAEAVAAVKAAAASPGATEPGKAGPQEAPRGEGCTEAVEALGLCTPAATRRGE